MRRRVAFIRASQRVGIPLADIRATLASLSLTACRLANPDDILGRGGPGPRNL